MKLEYLKLKLFTDHVDEGVDIAIVPDTQLIDHGPFDLIAARLAAKHCVFLTSDDGDSNRLKVSSFGPMGQEGFDANAILAATMGGSRKTRASSYRFSYQGRVITSLYETVDKNSGDIQFMLPLVPTLNPSDLAPDAVAAALGLSVQDLGHPQAGNLCKCQFGLDYHLAPLKDASLLAGIKLQRRGWADLFGQNTPTVVTFAPVNLREKDIHIVARVFGSHYPSWEHFADGTAALLIAAQCAVKMGLEDGQHQFHIYQGEFLGANGHIKVRIFVQNGQIDQLSVGGRALIVAQGALTV